MPVRMARPALRPCTMVECDTRNAVRNNNRLRKMWRHPTMLGRDSGVGGKGGVSSK